MPSEHAHLSERDLVLMTNGELPAARRAAATAHLESCWQCREHMHSLESTVAEFVRARSRELNAMVPPVEGPGDLLRRRIAEASEKSSPRRAFLPGRLVLAGAAFFSVFAGILVVFQSTVNAEGPKPRVAITPGEARPITVDEVCRYSHAEVISRNIPEDTRQQVFASYGINSSREQQFEVDYLITPDLGGTVSVRNLWPQPYSVRWNARVKDRLEERLHALVCNGELDLATAQREIAMDWIGAYKKYVGTNSPD